MRILLVEDQPDAALLIAKGLREQAFAVDVAADGEHGSRLAFETSYDAIVLDVMLPGRDGLSVCRQIRARGALTPILLLTAMDAVESRIQGLDSGADDYLTKPFAFGELLARVRAMVRRGKPERPAKLTVDGVVLDPAAHTVRCGETLIDLTPKEFSLLEFLMRHPREVLSRPRILEHVWDINYDGFSNVVDVYVGYLRRKLPPPYDRTLIRTVRGVGYQVGTP